MFPEKVIFLFWALIFTVPPSEYIAPPLTAELFVNSESVTVKLPLLYTAPPFADAELSLNFEFEIFIVLSLATAPPFTAEFDVKVLELMFVVFFIL